jgi:probable rRNA maturation factor
VSQPARVRRRRRVLLTRRERLVIPPWPPLRRVLEKILVDYGVAGTLSLALVDDAEIRRVHRQFLGQDTATDVLSFLLETEGEGIGGLDDVFGEVVVSAETALREASKRGLTPEREVALYSIHGTLHLVGFDDTDATSCRKMRREERKYLMIYEAALGH